MPEPFAATYNREIIHRASTQGGARQALRLKVKQDGVPDQCGLVSGEGSRWYEAPNDKVDYDEFYTRGDFDAGE